MASALTTGAIRSANHGTLRQSCTPERAYVSSRLGIEVRSRPLRLPCPLDREQIDPGGSGQTRPVHIPAESQKVTIGDALKFPETGFLHPANRCFIVTHDKN